MWPFDDPQAIVEQCFDQIPKKMDSELERYYELEKCVMQKADQLDTAELWALNNKLWDVKRQISRAQYKRSLFAGNRKGAEHAAKAYNETTEALTPAPLAASQEAVDKALEGDFSDIPGAVTDGVASRYVPGYKLRKKLKKLKNLRDKKRKKTKRKKEKDGMAVRGDCDI